LTTKIVNDRETGLKVGFQATDWLHEISFDDYVKALENWKVRTIHRNNEPIGAIYQKDDELHVSVLPQWRRKWFTKGVYKDLFVGKRVVTKITPGDEHMYNFLHRVGFRDAFDGTLIKDLK